MSLVRNLLGCCKDPSQDKVVFVRTYVYENKTKPGPANLGFTYEKGDSFNCLINEILEKDADQDKVVRVVIHELLNVLVLANGAPPNMGTGWYVYDSDTLPPFSPLLPAEADWVASNEGKHGVSVKNAWLASPTLRATIRINDAVGRKVFRI